MIITCVDLHLPKVMMCCLTLFVCFVLVVADMMNFSVNIHSDGNVLEIVTNSGEVVLGFGGVIFCVVCLLLLIVADVAHLVFLAFHAVLM